MSLRRENHGEHGETRGRGNTETEGFSPCLPVFPVVQESGVKDYAADYNDAPDQHSTEEAILRIAETLPRQKGAIACAVLASNGVEAATNLLKAWGIKVPKG